MRFDLNFNHLETFFSLVKTLSFSRTAESLKIAQPVVSRQIKSLEELFQVQLFIRSKHKVQITRDGQRLYDQIFPLYDQLCSRTILFKDQSKEVSGKVVFGCLSEVGQRVIIPILNDFYKSFPEVTLDIRLMKGAEIIEGLKCGIIDIGVVSNPVIQENIKSFEVLNEKIILVCSKDQKIRKITDLSECKFVTYREDDPLFNFYLQKSFPKSQRGKLNITYYVNSHQSMVNAIKALGLCAVLPTLSIEKELRDKTLINIGPKDLDSKLYLIEKDIEFPSRSLSEFSKFLKTSLKKLKI